MTQSNNPAVHAAGRATLEIFISSIIGIGCIDYKLINQTTISALSSTTYKILLPMFLGTNIIKTITKTNGLTKSSLTLPLLASVQSFILYMITTKIIFPLLLLLDDVDGNIVDINTIRNSDDGRGISICSSFGNGGVVPLIFCESLFGRSSGSSSGSSSNDLLALSTGCVALFLVGWSPFFWSFGRSILLGNDNDTDNNENNNSVNANVISSKDKAITKLKSMLPPPVIGVFIGMIIATIPIIRRLFITNNNDVGASGPLFGVVFDTMQNFGKAASPLSLLVLVSSLALGAGFGGSANTTGSTTGTKSKSKLLSSTSTVTAIYEIPFWKRWGIVSFMRFIISPIVMYSLLKIVSLPQIGLIDSYKTDNKGAVYTSMIWFICILESIMPPAQNQVTLLHVANKTNKANEMATFLFFIYTTSMIPLVIILSMALQKFQLI
ncbi:hypothetical protein FRACYDRAFT_244358 [Fragilariopsis cylindrus CCMP1102]|uniref:Auxin efflux carrier n=1 Tax=Fragilariopsis cylindrus CCMP1102 TaxID=635003 RepID=A0A1E7F1M9_9STRA|nr:hypothetical protein FRACYDRAFT_244358 [Fragilariopsis cylindrus CCMP1102]|eukprot:OEU12098.1 hypothetical protein FRACYDRAFT_244358 [Fragilariopsis cylindrus CCMP1102]